MPPNRITLNNLKVGERAIVRRVSNRNKLLCGKLLAMGLIAGAHVEVLRYAPLGDPIEIKAVGSRLSLRASEAVHVVVSDVTSRHL